MRAPLLGLVTFHPPLAAEANAYLSGQAIVGLTLIALVAWAVIRFWPGKVDSAGPTARGAAPLDPPGPPTSVGPPGAPTVPQVSQRPAATTNGDRGTPRRVKIVVAVLALAAAIWALSGGLTISTSGSDPQTDAERDSIAQGCLDQGGVESSCECLADAVISSGYDQASEMKQLESQLQQAAQTRDPSLIPPAIRAANEKCFGTVS